MYPHYPCAGVSRSLLSKYLTRRTVSDRSNSNNFPAVIHHVVDFISSQERPGSEENIKDLERTFIHSLCEAAANDAHWYNWNPWALIGFLQPNCNADFARDAGSLDRHRLAAAALFGNTDLVQTMIEEGIRDIDGMTYIGSPLQCAATGGNLEVVQLLLEQHDANLTTRLSRQNPLFGAALAGHTDVVRVLLEPQHGCIASRVAFDELISQAARSGNQQVIELIKTTIRKTPFQSVEDQILCEAAHHGHENAVRMALESGADINTCHHSSKRRFPISLAASRGHKNIVQLLLARGANQNLPKRGTTLALAAELGFKSVVQLLMDDGNYDFNDLRINNNAALSPLKVAAERGQAHIVRFILDGGFDIGTHKEVGEMALRTAAANGYDSVIRMLLDAGADVDGRDETRSPMLAALCHGRDHIVKSLIELGARKVDPEKTIYAEKFRNGTFPTRIRVKHGGVYVTDYKF